MTIQFPSAPSLARLFAPLLVAAGGLLALMAAPVALSQSAPMATCPGDTDANFFRDQAVAVKLAALLQFNKALLQEKIGVKVSGGVTTLYGNVSSVEHIALAGRIAADTEGVRCVNNFLKVGPPLPDPLPPS